MGAFERLIGVFRKLFGPLVSLFGIGHQGLLILRLVFLWRLVFVVPDWLFVELRSQRWLWRVRL